MPSSPGVVAPGRIQIPAEPSGRLLRMFGWIEDWQARVEQAPLTALEGSSLATDDLAFPVMPASHVAYNGLLHAVEHLYLLRSTFLATEVIYPTAYHTILRSALMGAAQAVWVLKGPRSSRINHALRIVIDDINQTRKRINDLGELTAEQQAEVDRERARLAQRLQAASTAAAQVGQQFPNIEKYTLNMGDVIRDAIKLANPEDTTDARRIRSGSGLLWRSTSGHAHGTPSSRRSLIRLADVERRPDGSGVGRADLPIEHLVGTASAAVLLTQEGWRHYDLRRVPHAPST